MCSAASKWLNLLMVISTTGVVRALQMSNHILLGPFHALNATKEVILSAGSTNTPHIRSYLRVVNHTLTKLTSLSAVLLSGIGDSSHLSSFGIDTLVDLPSVGQNLQASPPGASNVRVRLVVPTLNRITLFSPLSGR